MKTLREWLKSSFDIEVAKKIVGSRRKGFEQNAGITFGSLSNALTSLCPEGSRSVIVQLIQKLEKYQKDMGVTDLLITDYPGGEIDFTAKFNNTKIFGSVIYYENGCELVLNRSENAATVEDLRPTAIDLISANNLDFFTGNAINNIFTGATGEDSAALECYEKAIWYLQRKIERLKIEQNG